MGRQSAESRPVLLGCSLAARPRRGETWPTFRQRATERVAEARDTAKAVLGLELDLLLAAGALAGRASPAQLRELRAGALGRRIVLVEWKGTREPAGQLPTQDEVPTDAAPGPSSPTAALDPAAGGGAVVAVLDSGVEGAHPFLRVAAAVSTCPERASRAGRHGTHCAGVIASRSSECPGIARDARLLDIKVARASGALNPAWLAAGIDVAMDLGAQVLSISCGFNALPAEVADGHGWPCTAGTCPLCRAVDCVVSCGSVVVAAAGNLAVRVRAVRREATTRGLDGLLCPGRARRAITVGALDAGPPLRRWAASSHGMRDGGGRAKPEVLAPGVNVLSTVPSPTDDRSGVTDRVFASETGTSVAAAYVAGVAARLIADHQTEGRAWSPATIRRELLSRLPRPR